MQINTRIRVKPYITVDLLMYARKLIEYDVQTNTVEVNLFLKVN